MFQADAQQARDAFVNGDVALNIKVPLQREKCLRVDWRAGTCVGLQHLQALLVAAESARGSEYESPVKACTQARTEAQAAMVGEVSRHRRCAHTSAGAMPAASATGETHGQQVLRSA